MSDDYVLKYDPRPFIFEKGNYYHQLKILTFSEEKDDEKRHSILKTIKSYQNADGSWSWMGKWDFNETIPSSITDTAYILSALIDAGESLLSAQIQKASNFLIETQRKDGGWSENPELRKTMADSWSWFSVDHSVTWITGLVITALRKSGYSSEDPSIRKAIEFLKSCQNKEGGWASHTGSKELQKTDMWTLEEIVSALLACGLSCDSILIKKAEKAILKYRNRWREPVENPLGIFLSLGYNRDHRYVAECINLLLKSQQEDGGWGYYNDWQSHPDQTVHWWEILLKYGVKVGSS